MKLNNYSNVSSELKKLTQLANSLVDYYNEFKPYMGQDVQVLKIHHPDKKHELTYLFVVEGLYFTFTVSSRNKVIHVDFYKFDGNKAKSWYYIDYSKKTDFNELKAFKSNLKENENGYFIPGKELAVKPTTFYKNMEDELMKVYTRLVIEYQLTDQIYTYGF